MRLLSCYIENFGRHHQFTMDFSRGMNVIRADNGWGKTTLAAFFKAMFFGMAYSPRKKLAENERKRYKPWQGGRWGGYVTFSHGNKEYKLERFFGDKDRDDTFSLYDMATGLPSRDYSEAIGEELFGVDRDSFARSSFFPQESLPVAMTDRLNARLNRLEEYGGDVDRYDEATALLDRRLKEYKKTGNRGSLARWEQELSALRQKREQCVEKGRERDGCRARLAGALEKERAVGTELARIQEQERQFHQSQTARAEGRHREMLLGQLREDEEQLKPLDDYFRGGVPSEEELDGLLREEIQRGELLAREDDAAIREAKSQWEREQALLEQMQRESGVMPSGRRPAKSGGESGGMLSGNQGMETGHMKKNAVFWRRLSVCGAVFMLLGVCLLFAGQVSASRLPMSALLDSVGKGIGIAGLVIAVFGLLMYRVTAADRSDSSENGRKQSSVLYAAQEERVRLQKQHLESLQAEHRIRTEECCRRLSEIDEKKRRFLRKYQMDDSGLGQEELLKMRDRQRDYLRLSEQLARHQAEWEAYLWEVDESAGKAGRNAFTRTENSLPGYAEKDVSREQTESSLELLPADLAGGENISLWQLQKKRYELEKQREKLLREAETCRKDIEILTTEAEELEETEREICRLAELYENGRKQADLLEKTMRYLRQAKESYAARYMERMRQGFKKYMEMLDEEAAARLRLDAELTPGEEALGSLHGQEYMSTGLREFAGICTRLALVDAMYEEEKPFLIMDDPFVNFDEGKLTRGRALLEELAREYQIIYFTCHGSREISPP
ncbi:MAG TPA: hypothetical protein DF613_06175 [Lachnospiraceae bacterium]|nr:hypothetical protein [Lachnospiraceae bacterium]